MNQPLETRLYAEDDKQSVFDVGATQIVHELPFRAGTENSIGLDLYDQRVIDQKVGAIATQANAFLDHVDRVFATHDATGLHEFVDQGTGTNTFAETEPQFVVSAVEGRDRFARRCVIESHEQYSAVLCSSRVYS